MEVRPGFKQTETGVIPEDWNHYTLEDACERISVGLATSVTQHYRDSGVPIVRNLNIKDGYFDGSDMLYITEQFAKANNSKAAKALDVLTVHTGSNLGDTCVLPEEFDNCQTFTTLITTPRKALLNPYYLSLHMGSPKGKKELARLQVGGGKGNLNTGDLKNYRVDVPPLGEQRAIAAALSDVDALLDGLTRLIAKKRGLKQATMQQLLTGQTRLPGFGDRWEVKTVAELEKLRLVQLFRGQVISKKDIENTPGDFPIYSSSVQNDGLFGQYGKFMFDEELITWSVDGGGNFFHRPKHKFSVTNVCGFMRVDTSRISYRFLAAELQLLHGRKSFDYQSKAHPSVVRNEYEVQLPPLAEQNAIAAILSDMDAELAALDARLTKTRALKQAMMSELLTGKTRLPT